MGWWETAKVKDKVVCIDDDWSIGGQYELPPCDMPRKGQVFEITDLTVGDDYLGCSVFLQFCLWDTGFLASCVRPVEAKSTETGMKIIRSILDRAPVKEEA